MFTRTVRLLTAAAFGVGVSMAQPAGAFSGPPVARVSAPVLGYFVDRNLARLQPIVGLPGSGFAAPPLDAGSGAAVLEVAPSQNYALAFAADAGALSEILLSGAAPSLLPIGGALSGISRIAISPGGQAALLYAESTGQAQILTGLPDAPVVAHQYDWSALPGAITLLAVDDAGDLVLAAVASGGNSLFALSDAGPAMIYQAGSLSGLVFLRNSRQALISAPADNQVIWIQDNAGTPAPVLLAGADAGVFAPVALNASEDGSRAFTVDAAGNLLILSLAGQPPIRQSCACQSTQLQRMRGRDVFLLTASLEADLAVLDGGTDAMNISMVPPEPPPSALPVVEKNQ